MAITGAYDRFAITEKESEYAASEIRGPRYAKVWSKIVPIRLVVSVFFANTSVK